MAKKKPNQTGALDLASLSPEELLAYTQKLQAENGELKASLKDAAPNALPILKEVPADEDNEIEAGDYQWQAPTFTWDDGRIIKVSELMAELDSTEKKVAEKAEVIVASLLARKSGLLTLIKTEEE